MNEINKKLVRRIKDIYDYFDITTSRETDKIIFSCCHIHGGDNNCALQVYYNNAVVFYKCRTHHCEEVFGKSIINLIRGLLSHKEYDWEQEGDKEVSFYDTINFISKFFIKNLSSRVESDDILKNIDIPSKYFIKRGFSESILKKYEVGTSLQHNRAIIPIRDEYSRFVGYTGRSVFEKCEKCSGFHDPIDECQSIPKWFHKVKSSKYLYNLNHAFSYIRKKHIAVVVESPGNVWRLEESGINISVAIFGTSFSQYQQKLLDKTGAISVILLMDNDTSGEEAVKKITEVLKKKYKVFNLPIPKNDIADMSVDEIKKSIGNDIYNLQELYK